MDDKPFHLLAAIRSSFFFLTCLAVENFLRFKGIVVLSPWGTPFSSLAIFFPLWEFLYLLGYFEKTFSFFLSAWLFLLGLGIFFYPFLTFIWLPLFFFLIFLEFPQKPRIFSGFLLLSLILSLFFLWIIPLLWIISLFPARKILRITGLKTL